MRQIASDGSTVQGVRFYEPRIVNSVVDTNGNTMLTLSATASAVNAVTLTNAATGNTPSLVASGTDTNINLTLSPKGSASVLLGTGTTTNPSFAFTGDTNTGIYQRAADMVGIVEGGTGYPVGYRNTPASGAEKTTAYTLTAGDCGKLVTIGTSGSVVVPSGFTAGDIVYLFNNTSGTVNVTKGSITTLYQSGSNTDQSTITMAARTMAAIQFISSTVAVFFSGAASSSGSAFTLDYLIIAGGGSGYNGGGGAGGYLNSITGESYGGGGGRAFSIPITPSATSYTVTVGAGGTTANPGNPSVFHTIAAVGGGGGGSSFTPLYLATGGSGGGGYNAGGGAGTANQGYAGGTPTSNAFGGGGGAGAVGSNGAGTTGGNGGAGLSSSITGTSVTRAGGGGGGGSSTGGTGGAGGGGAGGYTNATSGTANTGGGSGGIASGTGFANGGSGVVILRYVTADYSGTRTETGSPSVTTSGIYTILTFNSSGTVTFGV